MAHGRDKQTDRQTDHATCVATGCIFTTRTYTISVLPTPRILNGRRATDRKLCRCAAKNESTLAQSFTMEPWHCHCAVCLTEPHIIMNISKPSLSKSNTGVRTLISLHKKRTLVTLKILFFVEQENAWDFHWAEWKHETHRKCVSLARVAWDLAGLCHVM